MTGLFGAPVGMRGTMLGAPTRQQQMTQPMPARKPGFFGAGGAGRGIAGTLGDFLLQYAGMDPIYAPQQQLNQALAAKQRQASVDRETDWQDWVRRQEWERANPKPTNNDTVADYEFIRRQLGEEQAAEFLRNKANPPAYRVGPDGQFYRVDVAPAPTAPVGKLTPIEEGGAGNGAGGFRGLSGETVTSTYRDPTHNRRVGGVPNSYHMRRDARGNPMARDSVPPPGMGMAEYHRRLKAANPHLQVINEGDHVHMEPR